MRGTTRPNRYQSQVPFRSDYATDIRRQDLHGYDSRAYADPVDAFEGTSSGLYHQGNPAASFFPENLYASMPGQGHGTQSVAQAFLQADFSHSQGTHHPPMNNNARGDEYDDEERRLFDAAFL